MSQDAQPRPSTWQSFRARLSGYEALVPGGSLTVVDGNRVTYRGSFFLSAAACSSFLLFLLVTVLLFYASIPGVDVREGPYVRYHLDHHWHGWSSIEHMVVFGDSWSATGFESEGPGPSIENPLGNPPFPGETSSNVANWVDYLTYDYNQSLVLTANFAIGGATVADVVEADRRSMRSQITQRFAQLHANHSDTLLYDWKAQSSLFFIYIGINDVHSHYESKTPLQEIFDIYADLVDYLYQVGARNFFFIDVPPLQHCPLAIATNDAQAWHDLVTEWNTKVDNLAWNFTRSYADVTTFHFSSYQLLDDVIKEPCVLPESCGFKATTGFCKAYSFGLVTGNGSDPSCPYSVDQYLWLNPLHITTVGHNVIAKAVSQALAV